MVLFVEHVTAEVVVGGWVIIRDLRNKACCEVKNRKMLINKQKDHRREEGNGTNIVLITPGGSNFFRSFGILSLGHACGMTGARESHFGGTSCLRNMSCFSAMLEKHVMTWGIFSSQTICALSLSLRGLLDFKFLVETCMQALCRQRCFEIHTMIMRFLGIFPISRPI